MEPEPHSLISVEIAGHSAQFDLIHSRFSHLCIYQELMMRNRPYEHETLHLLLRYLRPGDVFIDVGAHIGWFTIWASRFVGNQGSVYAFEPEPSNFDLLQKSIESNGCINVVSQMSAVSDHSGDIAFYVNQDNDGGHALWDCGLHQFNQKTRETPISILVPCTTLDDFCQGRKTGKIRMVKIDTEGAEVSVLRGAKEMLSIWAIDYVICEVNNSGLELMGSSYNEMIDFMSEHGYSLIHADHAEAGCVYNVMFAREGLR